jgi:uncharacterized protein (UPF0147 family)
VKTQRNSTIINNPIINPENVRRGASHMAEGDTADSVANRAKIQVTIAEWETIRASVNNDTSIPIYARREVLRDITMLYIGNQNS